MTRLELRKVLAKRRDAAQRAPEQKNGAQALVTVPTAASLLMDSAYLVARRAAPAEAALSQAELPQAEQLAALLEAAPPQAALARAELPEAAWEAALLAEWAGQSASAHE